MIMRTIFTAIAIGTMLGSAAAETPGAQHRLLDPYVPPSARVLVPAEPTTGERLNAQVEAKLRRAFNRADALRTGTISLTEAKNAHWGFLVKHFDAIDASHRGTVTINQVEHFLRQRGADR